MARNPILLPLLRRLRFMAVAWLAALVLCSPAAALDLADVPNPQLTHGGWVTDQAAVLGPDVAALEARFTQLKSDTGAEVAVVILPSIGDAVPRDFVTALFNMWGVGRAEHDDGVLVLHVIDQRRIEIETGYGLEASLPDAKCAWLIQEVAIPLFKNGELARGHAALSVGIDFAIRYPQVGHDVLVSAANNSVAGMPVQIYTAPEPVSTGPRTLLESASDHKILTIFVALLATVPAQLLRRKGRQLLYREKTERYGKSWIWWLAGLALAFVLTIIGLVSDEPDMAAWGAFGALASTTLGLTVSALVMMVQAHRRYAPRSCANCHQPMRRLEEVEDDAHLQFGQQTEERIESVDYDVWICSCNAQRYSFRGPKPAKECKACGYKTDVLLHTVTLSEATYSSSGLRELTYRCAHCNVTRTEQEVIPKKTQSSSSSSSGGSSSSSSFGGGSSGGGGAGGSY